MPPVVELEVGARVYARCGYTYHPGTIKEVLRRYAFVSVCVCVCVCVCGVCVCVCVCGSRRRRRDGASSGKEERMGREWGGLHEYRRTNGRHAHAPLSHVPLLFQTNTIHPQGEHGRNIMPKVLVEGGRPKGRTTGRSARPMNPFISFGG